MFPSQRGNFFGAQGPVGGSNDDAKKSSRSAISLKSRPKSPPLGASAKVTASLSTELILKTTQTADDDHSTLSYPKVLLSRDATLSKISQSRSASKPNLVLDVNLLSKVSHLSTSTAKVLPSSNTPPSTITTPKVEYDPFLSKVTTTSHLLSRLPSSWSNQQWSVGDPFYQYNTRRGDFNVGSISTNSKKVCQGQTGQCDRLPTKTQNERLLIKKLCDEAIARRRDAFAFYSHLNDEERSETDSRLSSFDPKNHKGRLCEFMLKLVLERQRLLDERRQSVVLPQKSVLAGVKEGPPRYAPVYCVNGKSFLGKPAEKITFPNSFASLADLHDPRDDPAGYRRFCTLVGMNGFFDNEIFFRLINRNRLAIDGVQLNKDENRKIPRRARVTSVYVDLPNGVYPEHLKIGRSTDGVLVIQEPWKF